MHPDDMTRIATIREAIDEWRYNCGAPADRAWILSDRDTHERNPRYDGPPVPHPEDAAAEMAPLYFRGFAAARAEAKASAVRTGITHRTRPVANYPGWFEVIAGTAA